MFCSYIIGFDSNFQEFAKSYLPSTLKEWLLILVSMRLMWIGLNFLTLIGDFLQRKSNKQ
jgi:hypothetical protein